MCYHSSGPPQIFFCSKVYYYQKSKIYYFIKLYYVMSLPFILLHLHFFIIFNPDKSHILFCTYVLILYRYIPTLFSHTAQLCATLLSIFFNQHLTWFRIKYNSRPRMHYLKKKLFLLNKKPFKSLITYTYAYTIHLYAHKQ